MEFNEFDKIHQDVERKLRIKKIIICGAIFLLVGIIIIIASLYIADSSFRKQFDKVVLKKEITAEDLVSISIDGEQTNYVYSYDKYIVVLSKNVLKTYNQYGKQEYENELNISNPIFKSNNRFLCVAESGGKKIYLISNGNIIWENEIEGEISKINVNKNGYVSVSIAQTTHKSVIEVFNPNGRELFKTFLSSTIAIDTDISNDNKYLGIAEVDISGVIVGSNIKIISMDKAQNDPQNSVIYIGDNKAGRMISNIKYQDKDRLICNYGDGIEIIEKTEKQLITEFDNNATYSDIDVTNAYVIAKEEKTGLFSVDTNINIITINNQKESTYKIGSSIKELYVYGDKLAINLGTEVHFINTNAWLLKKYTSNQEIKEIVMGDSIAGIVYRDKIEILSI